MKALWFTDLHLRPSQEEHGKRALDFILQAARSRQPDLAICTGDTFHTKNILYSGTLEVMRDFLTELTAICPVWIIPGNHDYGQEYDVHALSNFSGMPNLHIVDRTARITPKVGIMSYCRKQERFEELMKELGPVESLFGHFDMQGFDLGSGWEEQESWSSPELFENMQVKTVFSGHYHLHQIREVSNVRFIYLGTSYTTEFGESDQIKRIGIVDLESGEFEEILTGLTFHKTFRINVGEDLPLISEEEILQGVEHRVVVRGTQQQLALVEIPRNYPARVVRDYVTEFVERLDVSSTENKEDVLKKYVGFEYKKQGEVLTKLSLDQDRLLAMGQRFLSQSGRGSR